MPFLLMYWKQLAIVGAIVIVLPVTFYKGYESGKAHVQALWNQQQVVDAQAVAIADNKTTTQVINAQKVTQNENTKYSMAERMPAKLCLLRPSQRFDSQ